MLDGGGGGLGFENLNPSHLERKIIEDDSVWFALCKMEAESVNATVETSRCRFRNYLRKQCPSGASARDAHVFSQSCIRLCAHPFAFILNFASFFLKKRKKTLKFPTAIRNQSLIKKKRRAGGKSSG